MQKTLILTLAAAGILTATYGGIVGLFQGMDGQDAVDEISAKDLQQLLEDVGKQAGT